MIHKIFFTLLIAFTCTGSFAQTPRFSPAQTQRPASVCPNETDIANTNVCGVYGDGSGNSNWDWQIVDPLHPQYCKNWYARAVTTGFLVSMGSPFVNATSGRLKIIADNQDYTKAKGWELLQRKFGCLTNIANPYFILYNKYTGVVRVYVYFATSSYSDLLITVKSVYDHRPATLSAAHDIMPAPDKYLANNAGSSADEVLISLNESAGSNSWSVGEFYTMLDQNIAEPAYANGSLEITVYGVTNSTLEAKIQGTSVSAGTLKDAVFRSKNAAAGGSSFNFTATGEKLNKLSKSMEEVIKGINGNAKKIADKLGTSGNDLLNSIGKAARLVENNTKDNADFEKVFSSVGNFIGIAGKVLSFAGTVIGLFKNSSASAAPAPTYTSYNLVLNGSISASVVVSKFVLKIPATSATPTNSNNATYYNCPTGIFNLKATPRLDTLAYDRRALLPNSNYPGSIPTTARYAAYRLHDDVQAVVNTGAGLKVVSAEGALVARVNILPNGFNQYGVSFDPFEQNPQRGDYTFFNHMRADLEANRLEVTHYDADDGGYHIVQTPFYNLECMKRASLNIHIPVMKVYLRIRATLKRTDDQGEPIYFVRDYELDKMAGNILDIPADISTNVDAIPPYANYTIPPNTFTAWIYPNPAIVASADVTYPEDFTPGNITLSIPYEVNVNHSIVTSDTYYTTVTSPNPAVIFRAGASVTLMPNFEASKGSVFIATTDFGYTAVACNTTPDITQFTSPGNCYSSTIIAQRTAIPEQPEEEAGPVLEKAAVMEPETPGMLYPNPAQNLLFVKNTTSEQVKRVRATDATGRIYTLPYKQNGKDLVEVNVASLQNGVHILEVITMKGKIIKSKFIKIK